MSDKRRKPTTVAIATNRPRAYPAPGCRRGGGRLLDMGGLHGAADTPDLQELAHALHHLATALDHLAATPGADLRKESVMLIGLGTELITHGVDEALTDAHGPRPRHDN